MPPELKNVVVVGGSYVGLAATKALANVLPATHRILLIEPHSHFHHLFAFPRFAVLPSHEHKAFIPYTSVFKDSPNAESHAVVKARAVAVAQNSISIDRSWQNSQKIPFEYLVIATGTRRPAPFELPSDEKQGAMTILQSYQERISSAQSILIVGGGANGVQLATDIKEIYSQKDVVLAHSRQQLMPEFHKDLDTMVKERFKELGVRIILNNRINLKQLDAESKGGDKPDLRDVDGQAVTPDLVIPAIGLIPNTEILQTLPLDQGQSLINAANGYLRVRPTLQLEAHQYPHIYALGDVADTGARKAARPGAAQADTVAQNIASAVAGRKPEDVITVTPSAIHLTLGLKRNVIFRNPNPSQGTTEPVATVKDDGLEDMGVESVWTRRGVTVRTSQEYHL